MIRPTLVLSALVILVFALAACGESEEAETTTTSVPRATTTIAGDSTTTTTTAATTTTQATTTSTVPEEETTVEIVVEGGDVVGGVETISADLGSTAHMIVVADVAEHVHVHGYDLFFDVAPGMPVEIMFTADVPGVFEIELEGSHTLIAELEVS